MYSSFQLAKKYLHYYLYASNGKGHGTHSPFVFDFITHVLNDKKKYDCYETIEAARQALLINTEEIDVEDFGAGSAVIKTNKRVVKKMASSSLKPKKYAQLLYRMVRYYQPGTIVELGTSFGITTSYLASGNSQSKVYTLEGSTSIARLAQTHFNNFRIKNIQLLTGQFDQSIPLLFSVLPKIDLAFIDGNHQKEPTLDYFNQLFSRSAPSTIIILDDIHWSSGMEEAWEQIKQHPAVTLTIDLFFIGIVCFNHDIKVKQHFSLRF